MEKDQAFFLTSANVSSVKYACDVESDHNDFIIDQHLFWRRIYMCGSICECKTDVLSVKDLVAERISKIATTTVGLLCCNFLQKFMNVYKVNFWIFIKFYKISAPL